MRAALFAMIALIFISQISYADPKLRGQIRMDGSSTVFPITEAVAEEFGKVFPRVRVTIGASGTGGGFKKFTLGEIDINNASRKMKTEEDATAKKSEVEYLTIPVAYDGIAIVVNKANTFVDKLTVSQLKKLWEPGSQIVTWKDLDSRWPDEKIILYGPGTDSGTFDYFTEAINGKAQSSRSDFTKSEDDNVLVQGVMGDKYSLGYFGFAYYSEHKDKLRAVPVDNGKGGVLPTEKTINDGTYAPLSREVYIYVSKKSAQRPEVQHFVNFYIDQAPNLVKDVGYVPLAKSKYDAAKKEFAKIK